MLLEELIVAHIVKKSSLVLRNPSICWRIHRNQPNLRSCVQFVKFCTKDEKLLAPAHLSSCGTAHCQLSTTFIKYIRRYHPYLEVLYANLDLRIRPAVVKRDTENVLRFYNVFRIRTSWNQPSTFVRETRRTPPSISQNWFPVTQFAGRCRQQRLWTCMILVENDWLPLLCMLI